MTHAELPKTTNTPRPVRMAVRLLRACEQLESKRRDSEGPHDCMIELWAFEIIMANAIALRASSPAVSIP